MEDQCDYTRRLKIERKHTGSGGKGKPLRKHTKKQQERTGTTSGKKR